MLSSAVLPPPTTPELLLRGLAVGAMLATVVGMWRMPVSRNAKLATTIFFTAVSGYVLDAYGRAVMLVGLGYPLCWLLDAGISGYVWMMILVVFEDRKLSPLLLAPAALQTALDLTGWLTNAPPNGAVFMVRDGVSLVLAAHALFLVVRGWRGDLVEERRRLRGPFMTAVALFVIVQTVLDSVRRNGVPMDWMPLANAAAVALLTVIGAGIFLEGRGAIFGASRLATPANAVPAAADEAALTRLLQAMDAEMLWRQEGLTIGKLADRVGVPEHRLRRLINDHLGHRNFTDFVNSRRIEAAKRVLSDPAQARTTVAAIAYDHGFASLGPFNRAFKAETGASPREWRQREQAKAAGPTAAE